MVAAADRVSAERSIVLMDIIAGATADTKLYRKLKRTFAQVIDG